MSPGYTIGPRSIPYSNGTLGGKGVVDWYSASVDQIGRNAVACMVRYSHPERAFREYRRLGFDVYRYSEVALVPSPVVEAFASQLRVPWRRWLYAEALAGAAVGPLGLGLTLSGLSLVCLNWGIQMGWAYGINMDLAVAQETLRRVIARGLHRAMGLQNGREGLSSLVPMAINLVLLGLGQDLSWADQVMGTVRHQWRLESGRLPATHHEISTFRHKEATVHPNRVV